jgi:hypothetical protein
MIAVIVVGLFGYAIRRLVQAIKDTDAHGSDAKALAIRGGLLLSAAPHTLLGRSADFGW